LWEDRFTAEQTDPDKERADDRAGDPDADHSSSRPCLGR